MKSVLPIVLNGFFYFQAAAASTLKATCSGNQYTHLELPKIIPHLNERVFDLCIEFSAGSNASKTLSEEYGNVLLTITGLSGGAYPTQDTCRKSFRTIISTCSGPSYLQGGDLVSDEIKYRIAINSNGTSQENNHVIESRARGGSRANNKRPVTRRPKTKHAASKQAKAKHPASKRPASKKRPGNRPAESQSKLQATKTSIKKHTSTPSGHIKVKPLKTCKQLHVELAREEERLTRDSGSNSRVLSRHAPHNVLVARARGKKGKGKGKGKKSSDTKKAKPCGVGLFKSNRYNPFKTEIVENNKLPVFGYRNEEDCASFEWFKGIPGLKKGTKNEKNEYNYDTEHVLEWNTVAQFFDIFLPWRFRKEQVPNADPKNDIVGADGIKLRGKEKFCKAWMATWGNWPSDQHFKLEKDGRSRSPFQHIADVYPSASPEYKREEFTGLQKSLNGIKLRFFKWNDMPKNLDDGWKPVPTQIYKENLGTAGKPGAHSMGLLVLDDPGAALLRLRNVVGVRMYLNDKKVRKAMRDVKIRLQIRFDEIEAALANPKNARNIASSGSKRTKTKEEARTIHPWNSLELGQLWDEYMNSKWETARRHEKFIIKWENELRKNYCLAKHRKDLKIMSKDSKEEQHRKQVTADLCPKLQKFTAARKKSFSTKFDAPWKANAAPQRPQNKVKPKGPSTNSRPKHPKI